MGQVLHGSATTTEAVRRAIQHSQESLRALAKRYGVNPKTVAKWKARKSVADLRTGPKEPRSTVLTVEEEAVVVAFRRHTLLLLDDCLYWALQSSAHRAGGEWSTLQLTNKETAAKRDICAHTAGIWRMRFARDRLDGLYGRTASCARHQIGDDETAARVRKVHLHGVGQNQLELAVRENMPGRFPIERLWLPWP
jgi:transposase